MNYFVSGGSRGIGAEIVRNAIKDGHDVAFTYVSNESKAAEVVAECKGLRAEGKCIAYRMDVRDPASVEEVGDAVLDEFEDIHVVVNNAAITRDNLCVSMTDEEWSDVIATNLSGPFYVTRYFLSSMLGNRFGRFINISSVSSSGATGQANYAAAKAGLHGLTKTISKEYGKKNIHANVIVAGYFGTDMTREQMSEHNKVFWDRYCPAGRIGELSELSQVVAFLASEGATYLNGQEIWLTGGLNYAP
jgi:NAD(P)-dependent dehydrogenase (short-subunit alcohol dehydrogenase family)